MTADTAPFFSICVPQYNRTRHLIRACEALGAQTFRDFELCISDDRSNDGLEGELLQRIAELRLPLRYARQELNRRYDANLRAAIALARGTYCLLHGNDDCLADEGTLERLHRLMLEHGEPQVVITNFMDWRSGAVTARVSETRTWPGVPQTAIRHFRNLAFVTGVIVRTGPAQRWQTAQWDGSEMYQMYICSRVIATGGALLTVNEVAARKDIVLESEPVDSYARLRREPRWPIRERRLPMGEIGRLVLDAVRPGLAESQVDGAIRTLFVQLYRFTYPFWFFEYRRVQSWSYAFGLFLGLRPAVVLGATRCNRACRLSIFVNYLAFGLLGLLVPRRVFESLRPRLYALAKRTSA